MVIKQFILTLTIIANIGLLQAQYTAIPDSCFEQHLIDLGIDSDGIINGQVLTTDINTITELTMIGGSFNQCAISSLQGIDDFIALETLNFSQNGVQHIDVSNLPNLKNLYCDDNFTLTLVLPPSIEIVYARFNRYSQNIDLSQTINLKELYLGGEWNTNTSNITSINLSNCINLSKLDVSINNITQINISNNPLMQYLVFSENQINTFIHNNNFNLKILSVSYNNLTHLNPTSFVNLTHLYCHGNLYQNLDLTQNINLEWVSFSYNDNLTSVDLRNSNNNNIETFFSTNTPNLTCIYVDNIQYSQDNWLNIDNNNNFVETEAECNALSINETTLGNEVTIYPNPVKDILNIEITNTTIKEIIIYNILGKEVITSNKNKIDLSALKNGIYIVKIKVNNKIMSKKIIKIGA